MSGTIALTRREIYELVWSRPMVTLAGEFGLSDVGLAKICDRHRVPRPSRGYWAKLAAGKPARKTPFREISDHALNRITIQSGTGQLPLAIREAVDRTRAEQTALKATRAPAPPVPVEAPDLDQVHRAVRPTARALRKAKPAVGAVRAIGEGLCGIIVGERSVERTIALLHALATRLADRDLPLEPTGQGMRVRRGQETVTFALKEKTRREKHVPTAEELAAEERRLSRFRHPLEARANVLAFGKSYPDWNTVYTGALSLQVDGYDGGLRRTWADGRTQSLETLLDGIVDGIELLLAARKVERERRAEDARRAEEIARRRALAQKRAERETKRLAHAEALMARQAEARRLTAWLAEMDAAEIPADGALERLLSWTRARLASLQAALTPATLESALAAAELFPADDPLHDPLGDPPAPAWSWR